MALLGERLGDPVGNRLGSTLGTVLGAVDGSGLIVGLVGEAEIVCIAVGDRLGTAEGI